MYSKTKDFSKKKRGHIDFGVYYISMCLIKKKKIINKHKNITLFIKIIKILRFSLKLNKNQII
jgi:hypothetical protein